MMRRETLRAEHISALGEYGLGGVNPSHMFLGTYPGGEYILRQGHPCPYVYIVLTGKMKVFLTVPNGRTLLICYYASQVILGEVELAMGSGTAASSVQAITDVACICIPRDRYQEEMKNSTEFMKVVGAELAQKLYHSNESSAAMILHSLQTRLCAYIANTHRGGCFQEKLTETAEILGTSYRHLLRTLENLCRKGVLEKATHGYRIKDRAKLDCLRHDG